MWHRYVFIPMRRNRGNSRAETAWNAFSDDVGYLSGREVVMCSLSSRKDGVRLHFAEHREYCSEDCPNQPEKSFKYVIRSLIRKHR